MLFSSTIPTKSCPNRIILIRSKKQQNVLQCQFNCSPSPYIIPNLFQQQHSSGICSNFLSLALAVTTLTSPIPSLAIPSLSSPPSLLSPRPPIPTAPFSQSKNLATGLDNGRIRPCPSINPGCVSTNPMSASFTFPWTIREKSSQNAIKQAIIETQKNPKIQVVEDTPDGNHTRPIPHEKFG